MLSRVGQQLGNYRLLRLLGQGGFAHVYQGEHVLLHTLAAIKLLEVDLERSDRAAFLREARLLARLDHPNIIRLLDCGLERDTAFLVMEYAPYGTVCDLHTPGGKIPLSTVTGYVNQIAQALQYAHNQNIIHCDIKPTNMLVGRHNELLLSDFGLAIITHQAQTQRKVVGTSAYSAPEQLRGAPLPASDQYSLGIVIYEWLSGERPFYGDHDTLMHNHFYASPPPLHEVLHDLPPRVEHVIMKALAKIPERRFANIDELAYALEDAASGKIVVPVSSSQHLLQNYSEREQRGPLIGREQELERFQQILRSYEPPVRQHKRYRSTSPLSSSELFENTREHFLLLTGDPGIGKTRLAEEMSSEAELQNWSVAWGRVSAQETAIPYKIWIDILRTILATDLGKEITHILGDNNLSQIASLLRVGLPDHQPSPLTTGNYSQPTRIGKDPLRIWEAIFEVLIAASIRMPLFIVLDDLHLADTSSMEFLAYLLRRLHSHHLLIIGTCRDSDQSALHPFSQVLNDLKRERRLITVPVMPLSAEDIDTLVAGLPRAQRLQIQRQAAGNPLFAEELARALQEGHDTPLSHNSTISLPDTITAVLQQRINKLSPPCQRFLEQMTVLGERFAHNFVRRMKLIDETTSLNLLEEALRAKLLTQEIGDSHVYYSFWHPLLRSHLYNQLAFARRIALHLRAAEALRQFFPQPEEEGAAIITYHLVAGQAPSAQIVRWAALAADQAYNLSAYPEARQYYNLALTHLEKTRVQREETAFTLPERHHLALLLERLAECAMIAGDWKEACSYYRNVLQVRTAFLTTSPGEVQLHALLWCEIGQAFRKSGDTQKALKCYQWAEQLLSNAKVTTGPASARLWLQHSALHWQEGRYDVASHMAIKALQECERLLRQISVPRHFDSSLTRTAQTLAINSIDLANAHQILGNIKISMGELTRAIAHLEVAYTIYESYGQVREFAYTLSNLAGAYVLLRDHTQAHDKFLHTRTLAERLGDVPLQAVLCYNLGELAERAGALNEAKTWLIRSYQLAGTIHDNETIIYSQTLLASVLFIQGNISEARTCLRRAWQRSRSASRLSLQGVVLVALGTMRLLQAQHVAEMMTTRIQATGPTHVRYSVPWLLLRAQLHLQRALTLEKGTGASPEDGANGQLDAELKTKAQLLLAETVFQAGDLKAAYQQLMQVQESTHDFPHLHAQMKKLLGRVLTLLGNLERATPQFEQALELLTSCNMPLERARTLHAYGIVLNNMSIDEKGKQRGWAMLQEARKQFANNQALLDLRLIDNQLVNFTQHSQIKQQEVLR